MGNNREALGVDRKERAEGLGRDKGIAEEPESGLGQRSLRR